MRPVALLDVRVVVLAVSPRAGEEHGLLALLQPGRDVVVEDGATIEDSVIMPGATIASGAVIRDSIVGPGARVGRGTILEATCVIGHDVVVPGGSILRGDVRLGGPDL